MTKLSVISSLEKVFAQGDGNFFEISSFSMLKKERSCFQLAVLSDEQLRVAVECPEGITVTGSNVLCVPSELPYYDDHDDDILTSPDGYYPDLLIPLENGEIEFVNGGWTSVWFEVEAFKAGSYEIKLSVFNEENDLVGEKAVAVKVADVELPEQTLICTHWFHCDCLATYYGVEVFSEEHWQIIESFIKTAVEHGINFLLTPLFTPPLDTAVGGERPTVQLVDVTVNQDGSYSFSFDKLHRWFDMAKRLGIKYFEMSHLFTQWGAAHAPKIVDINGKKLFGWRTPAGGKKYVDFLTQFAAAIKPFLKAEGVADRCFFHVSDEPNEHQLRSYGKASRLIHSLFGEFKIVDALGEYSYYERGLVTTPIVSTNNVSKFLGNVPENWVYYCCGQYQKQSNRFMAMPSYRTRAIGLQLYKFNCVGFLQWGYNFWYTQYSKRFVDPFEVTAAGGAFPSGDSFVVYPGEDGTPLVSLRFKVFYDALQDQRLLQLLESKIGREKTVELIDRNASEPCSFDSYEKSAKWFFEKHEEIVSQLESVFA